MSGAEGRFAFASSFVGLPADDGLVGGSDRVRNWRQGLKAPKRTVVTAGLFGEDPYREWEKNEMMRVQQEKLKMRQNKDENKAYYESVEERRLEVEEARKKKKMDIREGEDPLLAWERLRESGELKPLGYEEEDEGGIAIPMASFGIPKFDNGERFDLRLPYADQGYEDPDADVMGKIKKFFGFRKQEQKPEENKPEES